MQRLIDIMHTLRQQCPWDRAQTPQSLSKYAIEEAYEVEAAIQSGHIDDIKQELGDLLLQVVFQAELYAEQGAFDIDDVEQAICEKLIRRHPHVFQAATENLSEAEVSAQWQAIKQLEKQQKQQKQLANAALNPLEHSLLSRIKPGPALMQAQHLQQQAAHVGFDFASVNDATEKLHEELVELAQAVSQQNVANIQEEFGDCLFALVNIGRKLNIDSEIALLGTIQKFRTRFAYIEQQANLQQQSLEALSLAEMDALWEQAKRLQK